LQLFRSRPSTNESAVSQVRFRGNRQSKLYHCSGCPGFEAMSPLNTVTFPSETEA
jgi:hypothetical protein